MKNNFIRWIYFLLAMIICALCVLCCVLLRIEDEETPTDLYVINGATVSFLPEDKLAELREPLVKLLANKEQRIDTDDLFGGYEFEAPDPDSPSIVDGYSCGLLDVTCDGTPELLVFPVGFGGSSGAETYYAYDIMTGEQVDEISTGYGTLGCYYVKDRGSIAIVKSYVTRCGTLWTDYCISSRIYDTAEGGTVEDFYIFERHHFTEDYVEGDPEPESVEYYLNGKLAHWYDYNDVLERFGKNYIPISETELVMISWSSADDDEDRFVRAEKMADALLSTGQKFIVP